MARLSQFRQNSKAINEGEWITLEEHGSMKLLTRGWNDEYADAQARRQRQAAIGYGGDVNKLPSSIKRAINIECLIKFVIKDVDELWHEDGRKVTFDEFCEFLRDPDYSELVLACFAAASQVGQRRGFDLDEAPGPLPQRSPGNLNGHAIEHS